MKTEKIEIELYHGLTVTYKGETERLDYICDLWPMFGWDIQNDPKAKECSMEITRELVCFGECTLRANDGTVLINLLPPQK